MIACTCCALAASTALIHASLPQILSLVYGDTAATAGRPLTALVLLALGFQHLKRATATPDKWPLVLGLAGVLLAFTLKGLRQYLMHDIALLDTVMDWFQIDHLYTPAVAATLLECIFLGPHLFLLSWHDTQSSTLCLLGLLGMPALPIAISAQALFALPILLSLASLALADRKHVTQCCILLLISLALLWNLQTAHCNALPWLLRCPVADSGFQVLMQRQSQTGQVSVLESSKYRILKAGHSLLGGEWQGLKPSQSIFSTFYMQAMALYTTAHTRDTGFKTTVLLIGLGAGTSAKTMLDSPVHDVLIDVAEIDCAVVSAAHKYFDLPSGDERLNVTCRDARIAVREAQRNKRKFDLISHDIFTGGDLAFPLFTLQFFQQLASILSQDGTLSINYVWSTKDNEIALQSLVKTLKQVFATVTIYLENGEVNEINNLVIFCKLQNPLVLAIPDSGRTPKTNLGVVARELKNWQFKLNELDNAIILQDSEVDQGTSSRAMQNSSQVMALRHWRFMRNLFKDPETTIWTLF